MKRSWNIDELAEHWSLKFEENRAAVPNRYGNHFTGK